MAMCLTNDYKLIRSIKVSYEVPVFLSLTGWDPLVFSLYWPSQLSLIRTIYIRFIYVVNTGEYSGQVGSEQSHLMETTDQWPLTGRASPVSPSKCLEWKDPSWVFQLLSPGKVPKKPLETRLEATPG